MTFRNFECSVACSNATSVKLPSKSGTLACDAVFTPVKIEALRRALTPDRDIACFGCQLKAEGSEAPCVSWCGGLGCPVTLKD